MSYTSLTPEEAMAARLALKDMTTGEKMAFLEELEEKERRVQLKKAQTDPI